MDSQAFRNRLNEISTAFRDALDRIYSYTRKTLFEKAKQLGITGYGKMTNDEIRRELIRIGTEEARILRTRALEDRRRYIETVPDPIFIRPPPQVRQRVEDAQPLREQIQKRRQEMGVIRPTFALTSQDEFRGFARKTYKLKNVGSLDTLYDIISQIRGDRFDVTIILRFITPTGEPRFITVKPENIDSREALHEYIEKLSRGEMQGSDALGEENTLDTTYLATITFDIYGQGQIVKTMFAIEDTENTNGTCLWSAVFRQIEYDEARHIDKDIHHLKEFEVKLVELYGYRIRCYADWLSDAASANKKYEKRTIAGMTLMYAEIKGEQLTQINFESPYTLEPVIEIVYSNEHFFPYKGIKEGKFYFDHTKRFIHVVDDKIVNEVKRQEVTEHMSKSNIGTHIKPYTRKVVTFDVETRYDEAYIGLMRPYSISWAVDGVGNFYMGDDCVEVMLRELLKDSANVLYCLLGYNSSRFDNIFLLPTMLKMDTLGDVFYQKNSILNISWGGRAGRHTVHDICRFTQSSLDRACREFKTFFQKIGGFNHEEIQSHYNKTGSITSYFHDNACEVGIRESACKGKILSAPFLESIAEMDLMAMIDRKELKSQYMVENSKGIRGEKQLWIHRDMAQVKDTIKSRLPCTCEKYGKLVNYNLFDVFSTDELYFGIEKVMLDNKAISDKLFDHKTIGSIIYKLFDKDTNNRIKLPRMDLAQYKRVRSGLFAGRTQCYKGVSYDLSRQNKYVMLDVKSLYPYVMLNRYFPAGKIIDINYNACVQKGLIGFYNCKINQAGLNKNVLPLRSEGAPLNWTFKGDMTAFINTVDIKCLLDAGAIVEILKDESGADDGFAFSKKIRGDDLFRCLTKWKKIKEDQDVLKARGEPHNVVLRNMAKTFLNSLSGKVIENIHLDTTKLVRTKTDMSRIISEAKSIGKLQLSSILTPTVGLITYERDEEAEFKRQNRPIYLGTLIYAYARDHMYRSVLADYDVIYQDTDSALLSKAEYERFKQLQPELLGDDFGQFALEDFSELFDSYITLSPKNYFIMGEKDGKYTVIKKGFKGVNLTRDKYIANPADYKWQIAATEKKSGEVIYDIVKGFELYTGEIDYSLENEARERLGLAPIVAPKTVYNDWQRFIEDILKNKFAYVLTSSMNKTLRNVESRGINAGGIYQRYLLKKVKIDLSQASTPFERPANEALMRLHAGRNKCEDEQEKVSESVGQVRFYHDSMRKFSEKSIIRVDFGGDGGNRAFNFDSYEEYARSRIINKLVKEMGVNFHLNEYPHNSKINTRLWMDIDMPISLEKTYAIRDFINSVGGNDNKILRNNATGKVHIVMDVPTWQPKLAYHQVKRGKKTVLEPNGEIYYDDSSKGKAALLLYFGAKIRKILGSDTFDEEWKKAWDTGAPGMRAVYAVKMKGGKCESRGYYEPIGVQLPETLDKKCEVILDCSIYKPPTGSIRADLYDEIETMAIKVEKKREAAEKKLQQKYSPYKYCIAKNKVTVHGVPIEVTQKFLDEIVSKLPQYCRENAWFRTIQCLTAVSQAVKGYNNAYALHEWSAGGTDYNKARNDEIWDYTLKNQTREGIADALYWLLCKANY